MLPGIIHIQTCFHLPTEKKFFTFFPCSLEQSNVLQCFQCLLEQFQHGGRQMVSKMTQEERATRAGWSSFRAFSEKTMTIILAVSNIQTVLYVIDFVLSHFASSNINVDSAITKMLKTSFYENWGPKNPDIFILKYVEISLKTRSITTEFI